MAVCYRLEGLEVPDEFDVEASELERPTAQAREVAARLETCAKALRKASEEVGEQPATAATKNGANSHDR